MTTVISLPEPPGAAARDLSLYEDVRAGRTSAFAALATDLDPVLADLALASARDQGAARRLVRHTWTVALAGVDLFAWRCSLRAWVAGVLVGLAPRATPGPAPRATALPPGARRGLPRAGPPDWADLPWGARWGDAAWTALDDARAALPVRGLQALVLADVHRWARDDAAAAVGLTAAGFARELGLARQGVHGALEQLVGGGGPACRHDPARLLGALDGPRDGRPHDCAACASLARRWQGAGDLLASTAAPRPPALDPELAAVFRRWRAGRRRGLRGLLAAWRPTGARPWPMGGEGG